MNEAEQVAKMALLKKVQGMMSPEVGITMIEGFKTDVSADNEAAKAFDLETLNCAMMSVIHYLGSIDYLDHTTLDNKLCRGFVEGLITLIRCYQFFPKWGVQWGFPDEKMKVIQTGEPPAKVFFEEEGKIFGPNIGKVRSFSFYFHFHNFYNCIFIR